MYSKYLNEHSTCPKKIIKLDILLMTSYIISTSYISHLQTSFLPFSSLYLTIVFSYYWQYKAIQNN